MFNAMLEGWAGLFYLFNKIFLFFSERGNIKEKKSKWRISAWAVYLVGLPAWVIIFIFERNWIAASLEAGGAPAMLLGLTLAVQSLKGKKKKKKKSTKWLDYIARIVIVIGIGYSLYDYRGLNTINQGLELSMVIGFLAGTYLLAKKKPQGYLFFMLMNGSNAVLMLIEHHPWLTAQQIISLGFVIAAFIVQKRSSRIA